MYRDHLKSYVLAIWKKFKFYGYRRISAYNLKPKQASLFPDISKYMAFQLMRELGIQYRMSKRYNKPKTRMDTAQRPNLIKHLDDLNGSWQTDITYIQLTNKQWVYLASVYNPEKQRVLGYKISDTMTAKLATDALQMASDSETTPLFVHSYMGSQYTSAEFKNKLQHYKIRHSYSLKGHPYDNGRIEAFHSLLKREEVYAKVYHNLIEVQASIGWYINWYNSDRMSDVA